LRESRVRVFFFFYQKPNGRRHSKTLTPALSREERERG
jgi:hypothetical protein